MAGVEPRSEKETSAVYPPLDVPKPVAENVWIVDSGPIARAGVELPIRMTVVRLDDGSLWLHSPTRCEPALAEALHGLGPVRHLVAPNFGHWTFLSEWQRQFPDAQTWAAPGLRERRQVRTSAVRIDRDLPRTPPDAWSVQLDQVDVPGGFGFHELVFFHRASRTLIVTDLIVNLEAHRISTVTRAFARLTGTLAPGGGTPRYLRLAIRLRRQGAADAVAQMLAWKPERVILAHGRPFDHDGTRALQHALRWLTG